MAIVLPGGNFSASSLTALGTFSNPALNAGATLFTGTFANGYSFAIGGTFIYNAQGFLTGGSTDTFTLYNASHVAETTITSIGGNPLSTTTQVNAGDIAGFINVALAGNDSITGNNGNLALDGFAGNDTIIGGTGNDSIYGNQNEDSINGGEGNNFLYGGQGNDTVIGGSTNDWIEGNKLTDSLSGAAGNDSLFGGADNDTIDGGAGNDSIFGNLGNDSFVASTGDDSIFGGQGNDVIFGGDGNDAIYGNTGSDTLSGAAGNDKFYFASSAGSDTITDFTHGSDLIYIQSHINGGAITQFSNLTITESSSTAGGITINSAFITLGNGDTITIAGVSAASMNSADFVFY